MAEALYLGVDGGGTGCRARLEDAEGFVRLWGLGVATWSAVQQRSHDGGA